MVSSPKTSALGKKINLEEGIRGRGGDGGLSEEGVGGFESARLLVSMGLFVPDSIACNSVMDR